MFFKIIVAFLILISSYNLSGQSSCPCCTEDHRMFDFWLGDWTVYDTANNIIGYNNILKLEDGCILNENWKSTSGNTGSSFNYYNSADSTWNQVWIDNSGSNLVLKGKASSGTMIMESTPQSSSNGSQYKNQISWIKNTDGSVTQTWNILNMEGKVRSTAFKGIYVKK